jgi:hypothetical protein
VRHLQAWQFNILKTHSQTFSPSLATPRHAWRRGIFYPAFTARYGIIARNIISYMFFDA